MSSTSHIEMISTHGLIEDMKKTHSRLQSMIMMSPTLKRNEKNQSFLNLIPQTILSKFQEGSNIARSEQNKETEVISDINIPNVDVRIIPISEQVYLGIEF